MASTMRPAPTTKRNFEGIDLSYTPVKNFCQNFCQDFAGAIGAIVAERPASSKHQP
jgi:hypothetical protein